MQENNTCRNEEKPMQKKQQHFAKQQNRRKPIAKQKKTLPKKTNQDPLQKKSHAKNTNKTPCKKKKKTCKKKNPWEKTSQEIKY